MSISVDDFLKKNPVKPQKKSKLFAFKNEIQQLREAGMTYAKITEFLKENGVSVSWLTVRQFVINHLSEIQKTSSPHEKLEKRREKTMESSKAPVKVEAPTAQEKQQEEAIKSRVANYVPPAWAKGTKIEDLL